MNTDDLLIMYTKNARTHVDEFEQKINQIFESTPRQPVEQYLGMRACTSPVIASSASSLSMLADMSTTTSQ